MTAVAATAATICPNKHNHTNDWTTLFDLFSKWILQNATITFIKLLLRNKKDNILYLFVRSYGDDSQCVIINGRNVTNTVVYRYGGYILVILWCCHAHTKINLVQKLKKNDTKPPTTIRSRTELSDMKATEKMIRKGSNEDRQLFVRTQEINCFDNKWTKKIWNTLTYRTLCDMIIT